MTPPDLLHPEPELWVNAIALRQVLTFAFASGCGSDAFEHALERTRSGDSRFIPDCFEKDLFVRDLVARCFPLATSGGKHRPRKRELTELLLRPPTAPETVAFRHEILRELVARPELARGLDETWRALDELFTLLTGSERGKQSENVYRRVEILRAARSAFDRLSTSFQGATSGLSRLAGFGARIVESDAYRHLSELLDHGGHLATLDVRLKLSHDGRVRAFQLVRVEENTGNRFHAGPLSRWLSRLRLLVFGYRVREEELVGRLLQGVFDGIEEYLWLCFQVRRDLEFYLAALGFKSFAEDRGLSVCLPELRPARPDGSREASEFERLYNPLLLLEERSPRPCDLSLGGKALLIVTGPNSGGKTRLLQAIGLSQLLAQAGFFVPAKRAALSLRDGLFVSVVEEAVADAREGRLGTELLRIRHLFENIAWGSLVIVDELCSGTNPSEAEEIFRLVLDLLSEIEPQAVVSTHFLHFAGRLEAERPMLGLEFLQVELDAAQSPTFGFAPGVAETSLAGRTAARLGVTREALRELIDAAKARRART
jgi:DNA mismatch repair protein MutS2